MRAQLMNLKQIICLFQHDFLVPTKNMQPARTIVKRMKAFAWRSKTTKFAALSIQRSWWGAMHRTTTNTTTKCWRLSLSFALAPTMNFHQLAQFVAHNSSNISLLATLVTDVENCHLSHLYYAIFICASSMQHTHTSSMQHTPMAISLVNFWKYLQFCPTQHIVQDPR